MLIIQRMIYYPFGQILPEGIFGVIGKSGRNPYYKKYYVMITCTRFNMYFAVNDCIYINKMKVI